MTDSDAASRALPSLPGFTFRPILGAQDAEGLRAIHEARAAVDGVDPHDY